MTGIVQHGLSLVAAQRAALLAGDAPGADLAGIRLQEWLVRLREALQDGSAAVSAQDLASLRNGLEASALIASRRASAASAARAAIAGAMPIYESAGFSARPIDPGRTLTA